MANTFGPAPRPARSAKALALLAVLVAALLAGCAVGIPKKTTGVTLTGATLNGDIYSSFEGDTEYWWRYGDTTTYGSETPHRTIEIHDQSAHPVSEPLAGLTPNTQYHFQLCARDMEESPPRTNCSKNRTFFTSPSDARIAFASDRDGDYEIFVMDADGSDQTRLTDNSALDGQPAWSPDGSKIAFWSDRDGNNGIYVMNADGGNPTRLTDDPANDFAPAWSPDGGKIAFERNAHIWVMDADGSNQTDLATGLAFEPAWSPDGSKIAFFAFDTLGNDFEVFVMDADGSDQTRLTDNSALDGQPAWSPDGSKIAFFSTRDGDVEIYVMEADGGDQTNLTNNSTYEDDPAWSPDGGRIAFRSDRDGNDEIYVMDADGGDQTNLTDDSSHSDIAPAWSPAP